jgi:hypothetical protein
LSLFLVSAFLAHGKDGRGPITSVWWKVGYTREQVKRDALCSDADEDPLGFLIGGDHLAFLFSQGNNFRNFNLLRWFFWHSDSVG